MICPYLNIERNYNDNKEYICCATKVPCRAPSTDDEMRKCIERTDEWLQDRFERR